MKPQAFVTITDNGCRFYNDITFVIVPVEVEIKNNDESNVILATIEKIEFT